MKKGPAGSTYSVPIFEMVGTLPPPVRETMRGLGEEYLQILRAEPHTRGDAGGADPAEAREVAARAKAAAAGAKAAL